MTCYYIASHVTLHKVLNYTLSAAITLCVCIFSRATFEYVAFNSLVGVLFGHDILLPVR